MSSGEKGHLGVQIQSEQEFSQLYQVCFVLFYYFCSFGFFGTEILL